MRPFNFTHFTGRLKQFFVATAIGSLFAGSAAIAQTEINIWHAMPSSSSAAFQKIVENFNQNQNPVRVVVKVFDSQDALAEATEKAWEAKNPPQVVGLAGGFNQTLEAKKAFIPLSDVLKTTSVSNPDWYLPNGLRFLKDVSAQRLMALPFMAETPVLFYNKDILQKAGVTVTPQNNTWKNWTEYLAKIYEATGKCPMTTTSWAAVHLESLAAMHDQPYVKGASQINGQSVSIGEMMFVRHIALIKTWSLGGFLTKFNTPEEARNAFISGKCATITAGSDLWGALQSRQGVNYGMMPLPHYPEYSKAGVRNPFVGGSGLWVLQSNAEQQKAVGAFMAHLLQPKLAGDWAASTGYLPMTKSAREVAKKAIYDQFPEGGKIVEAFSANPTELSKGFSVRNYPKVSAILETEIQTVMSGKKAPQTGLSDAMRQIEQLNQYKGR